MKKILFNVAFLSFTESNNPFHLKNIITAGYCDEIYKHTYGTNSIHDKRQGNLQYSEPCLSFRI